MNNYCILYNPLANNGNGKKSAQKIEKILNYRNLKYVNITEIDNLDKFIKETANAIIVICGGDGTLNYFVNSVNCSLLEKDIYYFPSGSGNDFNTDVRKKRSHTIYKINNYIKNLPTVEVNGIQRKFINGIGYGIDGYACERADEIRKKKQNKRINYPAIVANAFLLKYKPTESTVTVDGKKYKYSNVWINPVMNGRYYGGGMLIAPNQNRLNSEHSVSTVILNCKNKFKMTSIFPLIFGGRHTKHTDVVAIHTGQNITVEFDRPTPLQIDGEVVLNVTEYTVKSNSL